MVSAARSKISLDRQRAELLREHLDAPRLGIAGVADGGDVLADRELALAGELAVVDRLVDGVGHVLGSGRR